MARGDYFFAFNGPGLKWLGGDRSILTCAVDLRRKGSNGPSVPGKKLIFTFRGEDIGEAITASDGVAMVKAELVGVEPDKQYDLSIRVDGDEDKSTIAFRTPKAPPKAEHKTPEIIEVTVANLPHSYHLGVFVAAGESKPMKDFPVKVNDGDRRRGLKTNELGIAPYKLADFLPTERTRIVSVQAGSKTWRQTFINPNLLRHGPTPVPRRHFGP